MSYSKEEAARLLAESHAKIERGISLVLWLDADGEGDNEPIRLLEVNEDAVPCGIVPIQFGPGGDIPHRSVVIEVTPEEYESLQRGELKLPAGWRLGEALYSKSA